MYACLDLGSNSFHLLLARFEHERAVIVERFSEKVQLGEGVALDGRLTESAIRRGLDTLHHFREVISAYPAECLWSVGTNALRIADNASDFVERAHRLGFDIEVISGEKEGALVHAGVTSVLPDDERERLVIDIGGGSTEIITGQGRRYRDVVSLPMGCVSWRDRFFSDLESASPEAAIDRALKGASEAAEAILVEARQALLPDMPAMIEVHASSGTAKMLAQVGQAHGAERGIVSEATLGALSGRGVLHRLIQDPDWKLAGLKASRRDLLLPGWTLMQAFFSTFGIQQVRFSPTALREGMLVTMRQHRESPPRAMINARMQWRDAKDG